MGSHEQAPRDRLVFALDVPDLSSARRWVARLAGDVGVFKIGLELFVHAGPEAIAVVRDAGRRCFLDLKLHDIPETVARAVTAASGHGIDYLTIHASGGSAMLTAAAMAARNATSGPELLAITILTSLDDRAVAEIGFGASAGAAALGLARLAATSGVRGMVCSAHEAAALRAALPRALLVTPGIRAAGTERNDQQRTASARDAIRAGADLVVVGRPIRDAADPAATARALVDEIASVIS